MVSLFSTILRKSPKSVLYSAVRFRDTMMADPFEHSTGIEQRELCAKMSGNENPFDMLIMKRGPGTRDTPNSIPSAFDVRMVGCICEEDATIINWMWLHKGTPRRCDCGNWFQLVEKDPV